MNPPAAPHHGGLWEARQQADPERLAHAPTLTGAVRLTVRRFAAEDAVIDQRVRERVNAALAAMGVGA